MTEIVRLTPRSTMMHGEHEALMGTDPNGRYTFWESAEALKLENTMLKQRLAQMGEVEIDLHAKIIQLESDAQGPDPYKTWQEAATAERIKRVAADKTIREMEVRDEEACELIERWLDVGQPHDWTGWQQRVEVFLGIDIPEPIPKNVWYSSSMKTFYDSFYDFREMGDEFHTKWIARHAEFPERNGNCIGTWP